MQWLTSPHIHFDRAASAWLILRFIDPKATFAFATELPADDGITAFGVPGAVLGPHDASGSTFGKILDYYSLQDPTLHRFGQLVNAAVIHALDGTVRADEAAIDPLLAIAEGIMVSSADDATCLRRSLPIYDALYRGIQARLLLAGGRDDASVRDCTFDLNDIAKRYRMSGTQSVNAAFAALFINQVGK